MLKMKTAFKPDYLPVKPTQQTNTIDTNIKHKPKANNPSELKNSSITTKQTIPIKPTNL